MCRLRKSNPRVRRARTLELRREKGRAEARRRGCGLSRLSRSDTHKQDVAQRRPRESRRPLYESKRLLLRGDAGGYGRGERVAKKT